MTQPACNTYILCTTPRSGSTLLCQLLADTGVAGRPDSYFHGATREDWLRDLDVTPDRTRTDRAELAAIFDAAQRTGRASGDVFGLRLQRGSFALLMRELATHCPHATTDRARIQAAFGDTRFIHLKRTDKLAQAVSFERAKQTGLWHAAPDGTEIERLSPPRAARYDASALRRHIELFERYDADWTRWFRSQSIAPFVLSYDRLADHPRASLRAVLMHLGCDPRAADDVSPRIAKLSDATNALWRTRFRTETGLS